MSRLVTLDPDIMLVREPEGYQFGKQVEPLKGTNVQDVALISLAPMVSVPKPTDPMNPIPDKDILHWGISLEEIVERQEKDPFCQNIRKRITKEGPKAVYPYYLERDYLCDMWKITNNGLKPLLSQENCPLLLLN